jgi:hypothetical protein
VLRRVAEHRGDTVSNKVWQGMKNLQRGFAEIVRSWDRFATPTAHLQAGTFAEVRAMPVLRQISASRRSHPYVCL